MLRPEANNNTSHEAEGINIEQGQQRMLNTEHLWLNAIITHSKFTSSPFICLFSTIIPIISPSFASLYRDNIVVSTVKINASDPCHSVDKIVRF